MGRRSGISRDAETYVVSSFTDPHKEYTVTEKASPGRPWMCDCPAWIFAKTDSRTGFKADCKHIRSVQRANSATVTSHAVHHPAGAKVEVAGEQFRVRRPEAKVI